MTEPSSITITVIDLYAAINAGVDPIIRNYERTTNEYYLLPDIPLDGSGYAAAAELTITHDKDRKRYRAEVSLARIKLHDYGFSQSYSIGGGRIGEMFMIEPTPRYNAAKLADFTRRARLQIARMAVAA